ncbi:hypothetical protein EVAR_59514_1 [Eumeta japonica]|uniref:Uncharacterized protein n=1 Tax=Eumeta variegata TaxID=151549 RepID=A0A4C1XX61_EUMVA|nr:hypothetical protein EVAR_59514_1 [Eumeta japonica]
MNRVIRESAPRDVRRAHTSNDIARTARGAAARQTSQSRHSATCPLKTRRNYTIFRCVALSLAATPPPQDFTQIENQFEKGNRGVQSETDPLEVEQEGRGARGEGPNGGIHHLEATGARRSYRAGNSERDRRGRLHF